MLQAPPIIASSPAIPTETVGQDLALAMEQATVLVAEPPGPGQRVNAAGFLVSDPMPDGTPRVVLVTAEHVFEHIPEDQLRLGLHTHNADGSWALSPQLLPLRSGGQPLWTRHPTRDIAVLAVQVPQEVARQAIPIAWLGDADTFARYGIGPGDEMTTLGFPDALGSSPLMFPILRVGRVASYPLGPLSVEPGFLLDAAVTNGDSGGPVFLARRRPSVPDRSPEPIVAGVLTQQITPRGEHIGLGMVTYAVFVREALQLLDAPTPDQQPPGPPAPQPVSQP